jgi:glycosyltransferase involved in cell wall biosynthesis
MPSLDLAAAEPKLRICTLAACPFPANHGTPGSIRELCEAVAERGHDVHVVTYHIGQPIPLTGVHLHRVRSLTREAAVVVGPTSRRPLYDLQMVFKAVKVIRRHDIDVIHAHGYEAALVGWLCKLATGVPVVYSGHNTMEDELPTYGFIRPRWAAATLAKLLDAFVPRIGDRCVPHSQNIENFLCARGLAHRSDPVINFGIDIDAVSHGDGRRVRKQYNLGAGPVVLYAGVMNQFQRLDLLLEAMVRVLRSKPTARLLLVVTIEQAEHARTIRDTAKRLGIADHVVLTDVQTLATVPDFLQACDVAVVPRPCAPGFPIKLLNYMSARKPCVLFASSASRVEHRKHALLVSPDTSDALASAIVELLDGPALRSALAEGGHQFVRAHHDRRLTARSLVGTYLRTIHKARLEDREAARPVAASARPRGQASGLRLQASGCAGEPTTVPVG